MDDIQIQAIGSAISSKTRWKILQLLKKNEMNESEIAENLGQTQANISAQIKILFAAGLIDSRYEPGEHGVQRLCKARKITLQL